MGEITESHKLTCIQIGSYTFIKSIQYIHAHSYTLAHAHTNKQSLYNTALKKCGCKKGMWRKGGYYIIQYERGKDNSKSLQETHFSFLQSSQLYLI